jgi:FixJ family two-component response regulator
VKKVPVIAIVDDDVSVREATRRLIRSLGYSAVAFSSAEEFLQSGRVDDTSCLITDVEMPGMNGVELQDRLIADDSQTPVIFMTAFPTERLRARALEGGALGFLSKPYDEEHLLQCLRSALTTDRTASRDQ